MSNIRSAEHRIGEFFSVYGRVPEHKQRGPQLVFFEGVGQSFDHYAQFAPSDSLSQGTFVEYWQVPSGRSGERPLVARRRREFILGDDGLRKLHAAELSLSKDDGLMYTLKAEARAQEIGMPLPEEVNRFEINVANNSGKVLASARYGEIDLYRPSFDVETTVGKLGMGAPAFYDSHKRWGVYLNDKSVKEPEADPHTGYSYGFYIPLGEGGNLPGIDLKVALKDVEQYGITLAVSGEADMYFTVPAKLDRVKMLKDLKDSYNLTFDLATNVSFVRSDLLRG